MKRTKTLGLLVSLWLSAVTALWAGCCETAAGFPALTCFSDYLIATDWQTDNGDYWTFRADGALLIAHTGRADYRLGRWQLRQSPQGMSLDLVLQGQNLRYGLTPGCGQVRLDSTPDGAGDLLLKEAAGPKAQLVAALSGHWQCSLAAKRLDYEFLSNGRFRAIAQEDGRQVVSEGYWNLAADGQTILLYSNEHSPIEALQIKYLQLDELVLAPLHTNGDLAREAYGKDWFFNRL